MSSCKFTIRIPKDTIKKLRNFVEKPPYSQNEVICHLYINPTKVPPTLHVINKEPYIGTSTSVNVDEDELPASLKKMFIDCHTHPQVAYDKYNTTIGYPSHADYCTILENIVKNGQLFHILAAVEGLYVIGLHPNRIKDIETSKNKTRLYETWMKKYKKYIDTISHTKQDKKPTPESPSCWENNKMCIKGPEDYVETVNQGELFCIQFIPYTNTGFDITVWANKCNRFNFNIQHI